MVWGCISHDCKLDLVTIQGNLTGDQYIRSRLSTDQWILRHVLKFQPRRAKHHYIACSATENTQYHARDWKNTSTICSGKSWEMLHHTNKFTLEFFSLSSIHVHIDLLMKQIDLHDPSSSYYNVKKCAWNTMYLNQCNQSIIIVLNSLLIVLPERAPWLEIEILVLYCIVLCCIV
jgi:hypothetical protein